VRLLYSKEGQGLARVSAKQLLEASLRMRPDRILLAELRGEEAYYYLRNVNSGHPGSITSVHASSAQLAFEQLTLLVKESPSGREMARADVRALLDEFVDVVVQCARDPMGRRVVCEILYREPGACTTRYRDVPAGSHAQAWESRETSRARAPDSSSPHEDTMSDRCRQWKYRQCGVGERRS
jgi:type IV secretion system protein VirB11